MFDKYDAARDAFQGELKQFGHAGGQRALTDDQVFIIMLSLTKVTAPLLGEIERLGKLANKAVR